MKRSLLVFATVVLAGGSWRGLASTSTAPAGRASAPKGLPNTLYMLSNGIRDARYATPASQAKLLRELGCAGMGYTPADGVLEMLAALEANRLKLFAVYLGVDLDADPPAYDPQWKHVIASLKGRPTIVWVYIRSKKLKPSDPAGDPRAVQVIRQIAELAEPSGLKVALYPHAGFWVERVEDAVRITRQVNRKNVGVTFNLCHWLKVDDPKTMRARLELAKPYLFSVTINGADTEGGWDRLIQTLDRGSFDVYELLKALNEMGYTGPIGLQCYGIKGDVRDNLQRSMAAWRKLSARFVSRSP